jgi:four helix bundle protein
MTYESFEDTPVWQEAARLYELSEDLLDNPAFSATSAFRDQLDRAALSVSNNIAEGFERGTTKELLYFLYIARGSAGETRSMLRVKSRRLRNAGLNAQISDLLNCAASCSRQLRGWADALQDSDIRGRRHLNARARRDYGQNQRATEFQKQLLRNLPPSHPLRKQAEDRGKIEI